MSLTDTAVRAAKAKGKPFKLSDGGGLHLLVATTGAKLWRYAYRFDGKQKLLAIGPYTLPGSAEVRTSLAQARDLRNSARRLLDGGIDPSQQRKADRIAVTLAARATFAELGEDWFKVKMAGKGQRTIERAIWLLKVLNADLGARPAKAIEPPELLEVLRKIEARGHHETTARARSLASSIFRFGIAAGRCQRDPAADLRGALTTAKATPRAAITDPDGIGSLMRAIKSYQGDTTTRLALQLIALTFVRPGEIRFAELDEFDDDKKVWEIPGERMKMRRDHLVPLSAQARDILKELRERTSSFPSGTRFAFPSLITRNRPISENTMNTALRRLGYGQDEMCAHGFRAMASTRLNEMNHWKPEVIERQLAHVDKNSVRRAYNRAEYWTERVEMMQAWADYLDQLAGRLL
ncbi:integrase [Bradyrhizobium sp. UFLA03-84]|uniref:tyrosine-type recombinase/integrase n=1 Tax=Bradyrhizobium sp. UFLA03-84 TaxID=418599 RepID=UPI000BAE351D|nr:integrase arm-type DNA-binding domain-containing protein [Bradyrhizobium sp. UFLA03-84]PAY05401.1 integrase [Bradyrhizobium sp. UFLA03-84]